MTSRLFCLLACLAVVMALAAGCGDSDSDDGGEPPFPVRGMLTEVDASEAGELEGITLEDGDGREWTFAVLLDNAGSVTAAHLDEHLRLSQPVLVFFRGTGQNRTAYQIDDAP